MTILFSVIGLIGFRTGRMRGRRGLVVEGQGLRVAGLVMFILDLIPLFLLLLMLPSSAFSMPALSHELNTIGIGSMFCSTALNILLYAFCMMFGHRVED